MYHVQESPADIKFHVFHLFIATPEKIVYDVDVMSVRAPGTEGWFEILVNHSAFMTILKEGDVTIKDHDKNIKVFHLSGGYFEISKSKAYILADSASIV